MKIVQFLLMLLVILGANFYVFYRLIYMLPAVLPLRGAVLTFGILVILGLFGSFLGRDVLPAELLGVLYKVGTSWFFISLYFLMIFLVLDILRVTHLVPMDKVLYKSWLSFGILVGVVAVLFIGGYRNYLNKVRVELNLVTEKADKWQQPLKIVALSDLHLGYAIGYNEFAGWVELINKENPDIVLLAGDVIDNNVRPLYEQNMADLFKQIKSRYGIYATLGNHEYISNAHKAVEFYEHAGINILRDAAALVDNRFYVIGRDDRSYNGRKPIWELTDSLDKSKPIIVLDHQPYHLEEVLSHGVDLQLSGHTHRGQIWPISWITDAIYEVSHGYLKKENTHFYVSSGIALWGGKFRIGSQSEYVVIHLK